MQVTAAPRFFNAISRYHPQLIPRYRQLYAGSRWGISVKKYSDSLNRTFSDIARKYKIPQRIPPSLYKDMVSINDLVVVMLEHIDHLLRMAGRESNFGYAAYSISKLKEPLSNIELSGIKGVNGEVRKIIDQILETGTSSYLEKILFA